MIAYVKGRVVEASENYMVVESNGIGYEMTATMGAVFEFKGKDEDVVVPTYLQVREDGVTLMGFKNTSEKAMFLKHCPFYFSYFSALKSFLIVSKDAFLISFSPLIRSL